MVLLSGLCCDVMLRGRVKRVCSRAVCNALCVFALPCSTCMLSRCFRRASDRAPAVWYLLPMPPVPDGRNRKQYTGIGIYNRNNIIRK